MGNPPGSDDGTTTGDAIAELVEALTLEEKLRLVRGASPRRGPTAPGAAGYLAPIDRLELPALRFEDGPLGVKSAGGTAFPASLSLGASFDRSLAREFGRAIGAEARARGVDVLLAPGCNLVRVPHCGRNFEYYGEDPHQCARLAAAVVRGIQSRGVVATPKHYVANNQEHDRTRVSTEVDERTLRELYLPAFEAAVTEGDAGAVMAAYNRVNGTYATEHRELLTDVLREEFGFEGPVLSDWWAVQSGPGAARAGLDLEMPGVGAIDWAAMLDARARPLRSLERRWPAAIPGPETVAARLFEARGEVGGEPKPRRSSFARTLPAAFERGALAPDRLDEMVTRVLTLHDRVGALDRSRRNRAPAGDASHRDLARRMATRGAVLLKNEAGTLPLERETTVAVIGPHVSEAKTGGGGSSSVRATEAVSPLEGVQSRSTGRVVAARGHPPVERTPLADRGLPSIRRLGRRRDRSASMAAARSVASEAEVAVLVVQDDATEARDRPSLSLPGEQDALVAAVADAATRTVVVVQTAGPIEMPWIDDVEAVVEVWYPGQEAGNAIASLLYGEADPGGRLPVTFAAEASYSTSAVDRYPGIEGRDGYLEANYDEGVFVGYRHFDERGIDPLFPFGHGLSYATFEYRDLEAVVEGTVPSVSLTVENVGNRAGRDVVQVYVRNRNPSVPRPPRELAGFETLALDAGETRSIDLPLDSRAVAVYDATERDWVIEPGAYNLEVGRSSREIRATATVDVRS